MNERQHIALTEAQIIAVEKGELQLETRDGRKVVQFVWFREPCKQTDSNVLYAVLEDGEICFYPISGKRRGFDTSTIDLLVSEQQEKPTERSSPKPLYEVGEIIEVREDDFSKWYDAEYLGGKNGQIAAWVGSCMDIFGKYDHRKKKKRRIYISGRITGIDYNEAYSLFNAAESDLIDKGYDVVNPMKAVTFNEYWSWFDYLSADIKLMEKCTHIYMLSNWRESGGASVEHEVAKWNNFTIIYQ